MEEPRKWFGVRCLFLHQEGVYEERITIWPADSFEAAIEVAEREAEDYAGALDLCEYLGLAQAYGPLTNADVDDASLPTDAAGTEVFSMMRGSDLEPDDYLQRFFATGYEHQRDVE